MFQNVPSDKKKIFLIKVIKLNTHKRDILNFIVNNDQLDCQESAHRVIKDLNKTISISCK